MYMPLLLPLPPPAGRDVLMPPLLPALPLADGGRRPGAPAGPELPAALLSPPPPPVSRSMAELLRDVLMPLLPEGRLAVAAGGFFADGLGLMRPPGGTAGAVAFTTSGMLLICSMACLAA